MFVRRFVLRVLRCQRKGEANMPRCQRRGLQPRWWRAVVFVLGFIGRGHTGAPPHLPRGWTMHFHQGTPYFHNEYTGETTWDQPVPSPEETRDKQGSASGRIGDQPREISPTHEEYSRSSDIPTSRRGWFGFGRGAAKPQQQEETPIRLETRGTARNPTGMNDYRPTRDRDARGSPPREWPSDRGRKEMMSRQQGGPEGPGSRFGDGRLPGYDLRQKMPGSSTHAWGGEDGGVAAQPLDDHAEHVKVQPSGAATGGGIDRDRQTRDVNESPAAALFPGHPGVVEGSNLEAVGPAISGDSGRWMGDTTTVGAAVTDDAEPQAGSMGGLQGGAETTPGHVRTSGEISHNETSITLEGGQETDNMGAGTQESKLQPQTKFAEGSGEGSTPLDATTMITDTEKAAAGAGEQTSPLLTKKESPRDNEVSAPWAPEMTRTYAVSERQQGRRSAPEGEHHMEFFGNVGGYYPTEAWSAGKPETTHGEDGIRWGDGFPPSERVKSPRQDAGGWDWSDPWGQEGAWGAPGWNVGTDGTQPHHRDEAVITSDTRSQGVGDFPALPTGEERDRDGWGVSVDQTKVGGQSSGQTTSNDVVAAATRRRELEELACALTETRKELEDARKVEEGLRSALSEQERAVAKATAAAVSAGEKAERAEALVRQREEDAKENATAVGQWIVTLGIEQQELKGQLAAAVSNSTLLAQELGTLRQAARYAELRANTSEAKLKVALEDVEVLDEGLKQYMDGDGRRISPRPSRDVWRRVSEAYLRPLLPSKLKSPSPEELEAAKLERSLGRALESNSALAEAVKSKDDLVRDLNSRIDQFQLQAVRRRKGYRALKIGLADLTHEVQTKESMVIVLVVVMVQMASTLEGVYAAIRAQREAFDCLASLARDQQNEVQSLALEVENGAARVAHLQEAVDRADSALSAIAASLGAGEACVQRWKDAFGQESTTASREDSLLELLRELHAAAACKFTNPLGLEPTTGAITVAVPRMVSDQIDIDAKRHSRKRTFWGLFLDILCCRRRE